MAGEELLSAISAADEDYLIGMSNKGIYKRACKDLASVNITSELSNDCANVNIDDVKCEIILPLNQCKCSCPSASVCKHIIMAILHLKSRYQETSCENTAREIKQPVILEKLNPDDLDKFRKAIPTKEYREFCQRISDGYMPTIEYSSIATVNFADKEIVVKLLDSVENSTCTCHSTQLCAHKAEALICMMLERGLIKIEQLQVINQEVNPEKISEKRRTAERIKNKLAEWVATGLARASSSMEEEARQLSLQAHNAEMPYLEKKLREISSLYDEYLSRRVSFNINTLLKNILSVYRDCNIIGSTEDSALIEEISGDFREEYKAVSTLNLAYICTRHFSGKSGYEGDIYYFVEREKKRFYTYNIVRANYYENSGRRKSSQYAHAWDLEIPINQLEGKIIKLTGCKVSGDRLSSTSNAHAEIAGSYTLDRDLFGNLVYDDFSKFLSENFSDENHEDIGVLAVIKPKRCIGGEFNRITQKFEMEMQDVCGRKIMLSVAHSKEDSEVITSLEYLVSRMDKLDEPPSFFGRVYLGKDSLMFYPIELISEV